MFARGLGDVLPTAVDGAAPSASAAVTPVQVTVAAMNALLRDAYTADCEAVLGRWNATIEEFGIPSRLRLPDPRFHRRLGVYGAHHFDPGGRPLSAEQWEARGDEFLPSQKDQA